MGASGGNDIHNKLGVNATSTIDVTKSNFTPRSRQESITSLKDSGIGLTDYTYKYLNGDDPTVDRPDNGIVQLTVDAVNEAHSDYPELVNSALKEIRDYKDKVGESPAENQAGASNGETLLITRTSSDEVLAREQMSIDAGFSPANTLGGTQQHEMMHIMEQGLANCMNQLVKANRTKTLLSDVDTTKTTRWDINKVSNVIVKSAINDISKNWKSYGFTSDPTKTSDGIAELRRSISGYANGDGFSVGAKNLNSETLAEAYLDYRHNGDDAAILSNVIMSRFNQAYSNVRFHLNRMKR